MSVYNNIFNDTGGYESGGFPGLAFRAAAGGAGVYKAYNNTFSIDAPNTGMIQIGYSMTVSWPESVELIGNIFYAKTSETHYYANSYVSRFTDAQINADFNTWYGSSEPIPDFAGANVITSDPQFSKI